MTRMHPWPPVTSSRQQIDVLMPGKKPRATNAQTPITRIDSAKTSSVENLTDNLTVEYVELLKNFNALADGIRMIRRAAERASRSGVLPPIDHSCKTLLQECEAIARAIYCSARKQPIEVTPALAGLSSKDDSR